MGTCVHLREYRVMNKKLIYFSMKNLKTYYFIPLIFLYILIPILDFGLVNMTGNIENAYVTIFRESEKYIPILSLWWTTFIFKEYIDEDGNEKWQLLYKRKERREEKKEKFVMSDAIKITKREANKCF